MGIPVILATAAACGSLVTTMKSGWELSRMIRQKRDQRQAEEDAVRVYRSLRRALHSGRMGDREYDYWFEKFLVAESEKNREYTCSILFHCDRRFYTYICVSGWYAQDPRSPAQCQ